MNNNPFENPPVPPAETVAQSGEKLEGIPKKLWEKTKSLLKGFDFDFSGEEGEAKEQEIVERLREIKTLEKGRDYDDAGDHLFLETDIEYQGRQAQFKMVAQSDPNYDPAYRIDYEKEMPDWQKEAERCLKREAIIGQKLARFTDGRAVTADTIEKAETNAGQDMYQLKTVLESKAETEEFGYGEGRRLVETLLNLQYNVRSSEMINEIMREQGYGSQYELENEFSEDIFNDFDGYMDNSEVIFQDRIEEGKLSKSEAGRIKKEMEKYRAIIEGRQMGKDEYSLVHNECYVDKLVVGKDGNIYLSDWKNVGTTQNRELSLVYDLGQAFESARDNLDKEKAEAFMLGAKDRLEEYYENELPDIDKENGRIIAEAVIKLTKLRVFQEI